MSNGCSTRSRFRVAAHPTSADRAEACRRRGDDGRGDALLAEGQRLLLHERVPRAVGDRAAAHRRGALVRFGDEAVWGRMLASWRRSDGEGAVDPLRSDRGRDLLSISRASAHATGASLRFGGCRDALVLFLRARGARPGASPRRSHPRRSPRRISCCSGIESRCSSGSPCRS